MPRPLAPLIALTLLAGACRGDTAERTAARSASHRDWCIAEELAVQANAQLSTLDTLRRGGDDPLNAAIYPFARAYFDFAKARERELVLLDSAVNAGDPADSTELADRSAQARPRAPADEVQANAAREYQRDFARALGNPAHPCNTQETDGK